MAIKGTGLVQPLWQFSDENGVPYAGGSLTFTEVGTAVTQNVYSDPALTTSLGNVITLNAAGRTSTSATGPDTPIYFLQATYDYTLKNASGTTIYGPETFSGSQWPGQVQGQAVLSPAANANGYTNRFTTTLNKAGSGVHALFAGTRFDIPTIGAGASTLTEAATVYIEGAPATGTLPLALHVDAGNVQFDGNLTVGGTFSAGTNTIARSQFRLTLTTAVPVTTADVTAATTIFCTPYAGNTIAIYSGSAWVNYSSAEFSIAVPASVNQMYDVFVFASGSTPTLELAAWTNDTTRATALTTQDGYLVKTGATTRLYLGSFRTTAVNGQTEDSFAKRYLWNYFNRVSRPCRVIEATNTWSYTTGAYQQANASAANQLDFVCGFAEDAITAHVTAANSVADAQFFGFVAIGLDSVTTPATGCLRAFGIAVSGGPTAQCMVAADLVTIPAVGRHVLVWLEYGGTGMTWYGDNGATVMQSGIQGMWRA